MFATGRIALAAERAGADAAAAAVRTEAGQTYVWTIDDGKLVAPHRHHRPARRRERPRRDQDGAAARSCRCWPRASTT